MTSPSSKSSPSPKLPENCDVCGDQLPSHLARIGITRYPQRRDGGRYSITPPQADDDAAHVVQFTAAFYRTYPCA